jgi:hypothetical protein
MGTSDHIRYLRLRLAEINDHEVGEQVVLLVRLCALGRSRLMRHSK